MQGGARPLTDGQGASDKCEGKGKEQVCKCREQVTSVRERLRKKQGAQSTEGRSEKTPRRE